MNEFIKRYKIKIRALSPIHVGNGEKIGKKEYINLLWDHKVIIPDLIKMYTDICRSMIFRRRIISVGKDMSWIREMHFQVRL